LRRGGTWVQRWRVPLGFLCAGVFMVLADAHARSLLIGGAIAVCGLAIRAWASGHIRKNDALATSGPYAHTRNPLYLGSFLIGIGFTVAASGRWWQFFVLGGAFAALFLGIYLRVMRVEAATLAGLFGEEYDAYARAVPLFVPRVTPYAGGRTSGVKFDAGLYLRYREYRAALGLVVAWCLLALKSFLLR
jgi:protein-S-isoprenylcysteine O-methyltransferase Ste14